MKITPLFMAAAVTAALYMFVFERDALLAVAQVDTGPQEAADDGAPTDRTQAVSVVAMRSQAETIESSVVLRGRTEATRTVEVRSETSGLVTTDPLRPGALVEEGDLLCELDPGTRQTTLEEARARLVEARARLPRGAEPRARRARRPARGARPRGRGRGPRDGGALPARGGADQPRRGPVAQGRGVRLRDPCRERRGRL